MDRVTQEAIERLANCAHIQWSKWMKYLFSRSEEKPDGSVLIPRELVIRWKRQLSTDYINLPENEKASDRKEALSMLNHLHQGYDKPPQGEKKEQ